MMKPLVDLDWEPDPEDLDDYVPLIADAVEVGDLARLDGDPQVYVVTDKISGISGKFFSLSAEHQQGKWIRRVLCDDPRLRIVERLSTLRDAPTWPLGLPCNERIYGLAIREPSYLQYVNLASA